MIDRRCVVLDRQQTMSSDSHRTLRDLSDSVPKGLQDSARLRKAFVAARFFGLIGLMVRAHRSVATAAWGFNPRKTSAQRPALKGRQTSRPRFYLAPSRHTKFCRPSRAGYLLYRYLGLKPQAESCYPFGISQTDPIAGCIASPSNNSPKTDYEKPTEDRVRCDRREPKLFP